DFLLHPENDVRQDLMGWATKIADEKAQDETTLVEWITHFQSFCDVIWQDVNSYIKNTSSISKHTTILWADLFSSMVDTITKEFIQEYLNMTEKQLTAQRHTINELSSPVIPITNDVSVLPLMGEMNDERAQAILSSTL